MLESISSVPPLWWIEMFQEGDANYRSVLSVA